MRLPTQADLLRLDNLRSDNEAPWPTSLFSRVLAAMERRKANSGTALAGHGATRASDQETAASGHSVEGTPGTSHS